MPFHTSVGDAIQGKKIICEFEEKPFIRNKSSYSETTIKGNLAKAVVVKTWQLKQSNT